MKFRNELEILLDSIQYINVRSLLNMNHKCINQPIKNKVRKSLFVYNFILEQYDLIILDL